MLDELQAEAPDYEKDPLNYLLSVGQSLEEIEQYRKDGIPLWEVARAVHSIRERGESLDDSQRFIARSADEFGEDKTEFVWYPYIPVGDYSVLMADGGTGKTITVHDLVADEVHTFKIVRVRRSEGVPEPHRAIDTATISIDTIPHGGLKITDKTAGKVYIVKRKCISMNP